MTNAKPQINLRESRAYVWVADGFLSRPQQAVQSTHVISELSTKSFGMEQYQEWAHYGKTTVILSGSRSGQISRIHSVLSYVASEVSQTFGIDLPHAIFHEDMETMGGAATATGIIMPNSLRSVPKDSPYQSLRVTDDDYFKYVTEQKLLHDTHRAASAWGASPSITTFGVPDALDINMMRAWFNAQKLIRD